MYFRLCVCARVASCSRLLSNLEDSSVLQHISVAKEVRDKLGLSLWLAARYTATAFLLHLRFQASGGAQLLLLATRIYPNELVATAIIILL